MNKKSGTILDKIVEDKLVRLVQHKKMISMEEMKEAAFGSRRQSKNFFQAIGKPGLSIIGEFKKASPSTGVIEEKVELLDRIDQYNASVDAISCLTEEDHFNGGVDYLKKIRRISDLPILRKDFIIDEYQVYEAKVIGADAILLIAAILDDVQMRYLYDISYALGMEVLVEVHDEEEMKRASELEARIVGVNNRDLKDFSIHLETTKRLREILPSNTLFVSESGITKDSDIEFIKECKVDALLIGRAFMESENPMQLSLKWKDIYR